MSAGWRCVLAGVLLLGGSSALGEIVIDRTRVIYAASAREVTVKLTSEALGPRVVEAWIDQGDPRLQPELSDVPFLVTPPIQRMEAGQSRALRLIYHGAQAQNEPADRESVYWLNVLAIPPRVAGDAGAGSVQFAFRTRIKLFLRPAGLAGQADNAPATLTWRQTGAGLEVHNPAAYHVTLSRVTLKVAGAEYHADDPPMIAPRSRAILSMTGLPNVGSARVGFSTLDDDGATRDHEQSL